MISSSRENTCVCTLKNRIITRTHHVCIFILLHVPANVMCRLWQRMLHLSRTDVTLVWINSYTNKYACIRCDYKCRKFWYSLLKLYITVANLHSVSIYISNLFIEIMINLKLARNKFWLPCVYLNVSWNYRFTLLQLRLLAETWHKWNWRMKFSNFAILDLDRNNFFFRSNRRNRIRKESKELSLRTNVRSLDTCEPQNWARHDVERTWHGCWELFTTSGEEGEQWSRTGL